MSLSILITGINGFVGSFLFKNLSNRIDLNIFGLVRNKTTFSHNIFTLEELQSDPSIFKKNNIKYIINAAGKAHVRFEFLEKNKRKLYLDNVKFSSDLSQLAKLNKIKLMIHFSTSKVYGEKGFFDENSQINPKDCYSKSKAESEKKIIKILQDTNVNLSIIRSPVIYGENPKGNFKLLLLATKYKIPILTSKSNVCRSFLSTENLLKFIEYNLLSYQKFQIFNLCDSKSLSIRELISIFSKINKSKTINIELSDFALYYLKKLPILKKILDPLTSNFIIETIHKNITSQIKLKTTKEVLNNINFKN